MAETWDFNMTVTPLDDADRSTTRTKSAWTPTMTCAACTPQTSASRCRACVAARSALTERIPIFYPLRHISSMRASTMRWACSHSWRCVSVVATSRSRDTAATTHVRSASQSPGSHDIRQPGWNRWFTPHGRPGMTPGVSNSGRCRAPGRWAEFPSPPSDSMGLGLGVCGCHARGVRPFTLVAVPPRPFFLLGWRMPPPHMEAVSTLPPTEGDAGKPGHAERDPARVFVVSDAASVQSVSTIEQEINADDYIRGAWPRTGPWSSWTWAPTWAWCRSLRGSCPTRASTHSSRTGDVPLPGAQPAPQQGPRM